ncbi:hypothetical protein NNA36_08850 [Shimia sp. CNT1-13L.2]|uniref:hypothetical protein n=1 Tax=Shimia sp. CNT1-13L.2 TaxID=2959663 RepID=UPI0020CFB362|nr:hypothetical protein [Shimia sp. CNT1-13L.2]MCP9482066.1 hypothetical protein [Shimia sp. CNT1-13L.2]
MFRKVVLGATLVAGAAGADAPLTCEGVGPDWDLTLAEDSASFTFQRSDRFDVPQSSIAEGHDWPRAYTLIAEFDTAILLVDKATCALGADTWPFKAHVLTQRGQTPILLTGCCAVAE